MGMLDQAWKENVVKPIEDAGHTASSEFKNAMSGGLDPGIWINKQIRRGTRSAAKGAAEVVRGEIDYAFDEKLNPYTDKLDGILSAKIAQSQAGVQVIIKDAASEFSGLLTEGRGHIEGILMQVVDPMIKNNLRLVFEELNQSLAEVVLALRGMLNEIDVLLERYIKSIFTLAMSLLAQLSKAVGEAIAQVRQQIVEPAFERLDQLESRLFQDVGEAIDKLGEIPDGIQGSIDLWRRRVIDLLLPFGANWSCYQKTQIKPQFGLSLEDIEVYRLSECLSLAKIENELTGVQATRMRDEYAQLQGDAWLLACKYRKAPEYRGMLLRDWAKYGHLARLWAGYA